MSGNIQYSKTCLVLLGIVCAGALLARLEGIQWPKLHPDEPVIGTWIEKSAQSVYIKDRVYPNGFFALARPFYWLSQGLVSLRQHFDYTCGGVDRLRGVKADGIYFGRWFNALAGTLVCMVLFLLVARMARSAWAGLFAAALIGFAQYAVEHSHYAETDMAALFMLSVTFWLWVISSDSAASRFFAFAALASGFAAGTKFTLIVLLPVVLVEAFLLARRQCSTGRWKRALSLCGLGLLLFGIGFAVANPAVVLSWKWFWAGLAAEKQRVFAETMLNLGPLGAKPAVKYLHHFWCLHMGLKTLGYPWVVLVAAGLPCAALGFSRKYWPVLYLFPLLYAVYWFFMAPWVRSQEFLIFLPSFTALAVLPLVTLWRTNRAVYRVLAVILAALSIAANTCNGLRVSALFGWKDTRLLAREWLQSRLPLESVLAAESYAEAACIETWTSPLPVKKIEYYGLTPLVEKGADYLLRAASISGRGLRHPLTGGLYPEPERLWRQFTAGSELLCSWSPLPPMGLATFMSPAIELYGLKRFTPAASVQVELPQPALIVNGDQNPVGRQTFFPVGHQLGCANALLIDRLPQTIAVGGPERLTRPVYLVLNTMERGTTVKVEGFGTSTQAVLEPYDTAIVPLQRSKWRRCPKPFETITLATEPVQDVLYIPCFARMAFTVNEAARICLDTAREDRISKYFSKELLENELSPDMKCLAGSVLRPAEPEGQAALNLQGEIIRCLQADSAAVSINGHSGYYYDQFARARLQPPYDWAGLPSGDEIRQTTPLATLKELELQLPEYPAMAAREEKYCQTLVLPVLLARGRYELRGEIMLRPVEKGSGAKVPLTVFQTQAGTEEISHVELQPGKWLAFMLIFRPGRESQPCLKFQTPVAAKVCLRNMEVTWNLASALGAVKNDLVLASITGGVAQGGADAGLGPELKGKVVFAPWLALVDFDFNPETREVKCVFEALRNHTPPLAAVFWLQRRGEWRRKQTQPIGAGKWLSKSERETVTVRLNEAFGEQTDRDKIGLGIETDVLWHPGAIPLKDGGYVVPLAALR